MTERILVADAARTAGPPDARPANRTGSDPPHDAFGALLDKHQARTAVAEGQKRTEGSEKSRADKAHAPADAPQDAPPAAEASDVRPDEAVAEQSVTVAHAPTAEPELPVAAEMAVAQRTPAQPAPVAPEVQPAVVAPVPTASEQTTGQAAPAVPQPQPAEPVVQAPASQPAKPVSDATPVERAATQPAVNELEASEAEVAQPAEGRVPVQAQSPKAEGPAPRTPVHPVADGWPAVAEQQPQPAPSSAQQQTPQQQASQQQPQSQPQQAPVQREAPAAQVAPAQAPAVVSAPAQPVQTAPDARYTAPVRLHEAAENVDAAIRLAAGRGVTHARMALHPAELGGVEIHLRHTQAGLVAHVVADHTAAAHVLREAGAELRRSLEAQGIDLLRLDIGTAQGDDRRSLGNEGTAGGGAGRSNHRAAPDAVAAEEQVTETSIRLPSGALIDVLA